MPPNPLPKSQLLDAQLRVALLTVADDEQPMGFGECAEGFRNARVADAAFVFFQVAVFPRHAALHQGIAHLGRHIREKRIGNGGHDLAEQGAQPSGIYAVAFQSFVPQLQVIPLGHQGTGIPQGAVNIKNQAFKFHRVPRPSSGGCGR